MFTAPLWVREQEAPDCMTDSGGRPDCSCSSMGRTIGRISCSSPAWQHAPQVPHEVAVDAAETLTVNVRLHGRVDEKVCSPSAGCCLSA